MKQNDYFQKSQYPFLSASFDLHNTPPGEIDYRIKHLKKGMMDRGLDALLIIQKMDVYYFSGTTQDGVLFVPVDHQPILFVKREICRAEAESALDTIIEFQSIKEIPKRLDDFNLPSPKTIGLELDVLPANDYFKIKKLFPPSRLSDASKIIRDIRKTKSPYELECMKNAGRIGERTYVEGIKHLKEGISEIEFGGMLEREAKKLGSEGLLRVRSMNYEAYSWHILAGPTGGIVSQSDSPMGGLGLSPAFPVGASRRPIQANEPIVVDFGTCSQGYQADETRTFCIGELPKKFLDAYEACDEIHNAVLSETRPGVHCEYLFELSVKTAKKLGYEENYLGPPGLQTRFVGHGIGLELNEFPFLAKGHSYELEEGMTFALEPKIVFPGEGAVGIENTVYVNRDGYEFVTPLENRLFVV